MTTTSDRNGLGLVPPELRQTFELSASEVRDRLPNGGTCRGFEFWKRWNPSFKVDEYETRPCKYNANIWKDSNQDQRAGLVETFKEWCSIRGYVPDVVPVSTCNLCLLDFIASEREREKFHEERRKALQKAREKKEKARRL